MNLAALSSFLEPVPQFQQLRDDLKRPQVSTTTQVVSDGLPYVLATLWKVLETPMLIVVPRPEQASRLHEQLQAWTGAEDSIHHFPETETQPFERQVTDIETVQQRIRALHALNSTEGGPPIVVTSAVALAQRTLSQETFENIEHTISVGDQVDLEDTLDLWRRMGYRFEASVYQPGFVSRRGGIIDVFPVGASLPARVELWGNEIDSIRLFDPNTQRSIEIVDHVDIMPAHETLPAMTDHDQIDAQMSRIAISNCTQAYQERIQEEFSQLLDGHEIDDLNLYAGFFNHGTLLDYFPKDGLVVTHRPTDIASVALETEERIHELREVKEQRGELPANFPSFHEPWVETGSHLDAVARRLQTTIWGEDDLTYRQVHRIPISSAPTFLGKLDMFVEEATELTGDGHAVVAITSHSKRLTEILEDYGASANLPASLDKSPEPGTLTVLQAEGASFGDGFTLPSVGHKLIVLGDTEIFGVAKQRRTARRTGVRWDTFLEEISPGDHVVHVEHGIGRFVGTGRPTENTDPTAEYLILQYAQGDKLYVPMEHLDRVTPYIAPSDNPPHLTRLGTQEWSRAKAKAERSTREMAAELLSLYAARELVEGYAHGPDSPWQAELEESFPFEETPDQLATIAEVKADMENTKPMDRLVCGDVGYGKTEIALRAAFKTVMDGKQVAVLVPTTVLAQQHYVTFSQRLSAYPTKIDVLSRFRTAKEQSNIVDALASGQIDICIGTHRIIQKDVRFKDLGLVIVDEEQRFGVGHKERLKRLRQEVDVLTLTATPIPRTLHMSLAGVRDMSTMETPPEERLPIKTYVSEFSDELIREAILRELDREGQIYFLHNRVYNIAYMADYIRRIVPEAEVGIAHGQMGERGLEEAMADFSEGKFDVLVCTTIIESGLDIQNVNTLIVNRADAFGLAQLYQLRGRVGRGARRAYTYLLIPKTQSLSETAERRLKAMMAATELGAGFRIAMKDLEIRGAGNILGAEQSGNIHAVGFDLYTKLLATAVEELRAQRDSGQNETSQVDGGLSVQELGDAVDGKISEVMSPDPGVGVDIGIPASLPAEYIADLPVRLILYQRLIKMTDISTINEVEDELRDRFGPLPWQAQNLLYMTRMKLEAGNAGIEAIVRESDRIVLRLRDEVGGGRRALQRHLGRNAEVGNLQIRLNLDRMGADWEKPLMETVQSMAEFRRQLLEEFVGAASGS